MTGRAAIRYQAASFDTRVGRMMGRQAVSGAFLRAWIAHMAPVPLTGWCGSAAEAAAFRAHAAELGAEGDVAVAGPGAEGPLAAAGALLVGDPAIAPFAWSRRAGHEARWSLIGITHTVAGRNGMDALAQSILAPVQPWDAIICTSRAVQAVARQVFADQAAFLADRFGATRCPGPELPVIPLGVDTARFARRAEDRAAWRARLGLAEDDVAVIQLGRLAAHAKAHPLPLYQALALAGARAGRRPHLILAGLFANPQQEALYRALAARFADRIETHLVPGDDPDFATVLAGADIFSFLVDNIQESFGVAPVEAMAAGLPVVASDWDGVRDTVAHGETGFRIPTLMPPPGAGGALALPHDSAADSYDAHVGAVAQSTAIDLAAAADAFAALIADPARARAMGEAGRARAARLYDWRVVIGQYRALLAAMEERRGHAVRAPRRAGAPARPGRDDPFRAFASYPSLALARDELLAPGPAGRRVADLAADAALVTLVPAALPPAAVIDDLVARLPATVGDLLAAHPAEDPARLLRAIGFALKYGLAAPATPPKVR